MLRLKLAAYRTVRRMVRAGCTIVPDKLAVMLHESTDLVRSLDYSDKTILMHVESDVELRVRLKSVAKEPEMLPWLRDSLQAGDVLYDIGANVGAYSLLAAALHDGAVDVLSFEPSATNYAQLCRNLALNSWSRCVIPLPFALADKRTLLPFGYSDLTAGAALHTVGATTDTVERSYVQHVVGIPLDELISEYRLPKPNAVKIDVDGGELSVLLGAEKTLCEGAVRSILIELEDASQETEQVKKLLHSWGYREVQRGAWAVGMLAGRLARNANHVYERVPALAP